LAAIWESRVLTNGGPYHQRFEQALEELTGCPHIALCANGTLALVLALQALRITGEVITTPCSFVATSHALHWNGIKPVFVDIDPETLNIDPSKIEAAITPQTTAILALHCYGQPAETAAIQKIADIYNLKVIYDAAHAFGVQDSGGSILRHGDMTITSFHATKVFTTFEGGAIVCPDAKAKQRINYLKNFGFADETTVIAPGINGKMNEFSAALGIVQLEHFDSVIAHRHTIDTAYRSLLDDIRGIRCLAFDKIEKRNYSYFPILIDGDHPESRDKLYERLKKHEIFSRRYFYPLISNFPTYRSLPSSQPCNLPVANKASEQVLCLPIHSSVTITDVEEVCSKIALAGQ
jgi:dTDP-4-amino-4,6-dideoxygalactose transaminase